MFTKYSHHNGYQDGSHLQPFQYQQQTYNQQSYLRQQQQAPQQISYGFNQPNSPTSSSSTPSSSTAMGNSFQNQRQINLQQQQQQEQFLQEQVFYQQQLLQQQSQIKEQQRQKEQKQKTNILNIYKEGKQKIMMSFYNLYRNYPTEPPHFSPSPIWLMGRCYTSKDNNSNNNSNNNQVPQTQPTQLQQSIGIFQNNNSNSNNNNNHNNNHNNNNNNLTTDLIYRPAIESGFLSDVASMIWFSYRKDFPPIENTNITTDIGWGCMLRTGQMILARALIKHLYKENDMVPEIERKKPHSNYSQVLAWFSDYPSKEHVYGIHQIVNKKQAMEKNNRKQQILREQVISLNRGGGGSSKGKKKKEKEEEINDNVEEWLAPTRISNILRQLIKFQHLEDLEMYVPTDGVIYKDYINNLCNNSNTHNHYQIIQQQLQHLREQQNIQQNNNKNNNNNNPTTTTTTTTTATSSNNNNNQSPPSRVPNGYNNQVFDDESLFDYNTAISSIPPKWKSLIIMIPLKLGADKLNSTYIEKLKLLLKLPQSLGFIGGKPKQSFYFIGFQDDQVIYLDPHFVQESVNPNSFDYSNTYSGCIPQKMPFTQLDPSLSIGFYCRDQASFEDLCDRLSVINNCEFPIISVCQKLPDYQIECELVDDYAESETTEMLAITIANGGNNHSCIPENIVVDDEEFIVHHHIPYNPNNNQNNNQNNNNNNNKNNNNNNNQQQTPNYPPKLNTYQPDFSSDGEIDDFTMVG
nr:autophagy protein 4 [Dictyostelium discoideum]